MLIKDNEDHKEDCICSECNLLRKLFENFLKKGE